MDFSDSEGVLGPQACAAPSAAFEAGAATVRARLSPEHQRTYDEFRRAFALAAGTGIVVFG